jgi:hypothetical protein
MTRSEVEKPQQQLANELLEWQLARASPTLALMMSAEQSLVTSLLSYLITKFLLDMSEVKEAELLHFFHPLFPLFFRLPSWKGFPVPRWRRKTAMSEAH